jgi:predicted ATPase
MKVKFENLGNLHSVNIELNKLVIFTGESNSGKTYLNYALYALLDERYGFVESNIFESVVSEIVNKGIYKLSLKVLLETYAPKMLRSYEKRFAQNMPRFFSASREQFSKFKLSLEQDDICNHERLSEFFKVVVR